MSDVKVLVDNDGVTVYNASLSEVDVGQKQTKALQQSGAEG